MAAVVGQSNSTLVHLALSSTLTCRFATGLGTGLKICAMTPATPQRVHQQSPQRRLLLQRAGSMSSAITARGLFTALAMASLTSTTSTPTSAPTSTMASPTWTTRLGSLSPTTHGSTWLLLMRAVTKPTVTGTVTGGSII